MPAPQELKLKISLLPDTPGVYIYLNDEGKVIYVGKAKNLKRRVSSYFNKVHAVARTNILVRHIADMRYVVVNSEEEALDLENSLIKEYQPRYNVLLKDDKSYPWICVTKEMYPRVFITRDKTNKGAFFFGPYPKAEVAWTVLSTIRKIYPLRTCRHNITPETVQNRKHRLCLQFHIKNCEGCCHGMVTQEQYGRYIDDIKHILKGDTRRVSDFIRRDMMQLAAELRFEEAQQLKRKYDLVETYRAKSVVVNPAISSVDVFGIIIDHGSAFVNHLHVRDGAIVRSLTLEYRIQATDADDTPEDIISTAIRDMRERCDDNGTHDEAREIIANVMPEFVPHETIVTLPQRGDKKKLLEISLKNAAQYRDEKLKRMEKLNPDQRLMRTLDTLKRDFRLKELPRHIECFDNSHIQGADAVAACVVFINAKPAKKEYRYFNINTADARDDYASMKEVVTRRYSRLLAEGGELPQLIVVDGGKGQLNAAVEALEEVGLRHKIAVVGIAKRFEEIYFPGDSVPLYIDKNSESLRIVQQLRDEAHRFGIKHHRNKRSKSQLTSSLDGIKGVGPKTTQALLKHFRSVKKIKEATESQLAQIIGTSKAKLLFQALHND